MDDLREWLDKVDEIGELLRINGADWDEEIGCITEMSGRRKNSPALLFNKIKGYAEGYRILCSFLNSIRRVALTLNLPAVHSEMDLLQIMRDKLPEWEAKAGAFAPEVIDSGPVLENVHSGKEVNLLEFPVPKWHELDGGRYIGTGNAVITCDPDTGEVNLGTYRVMIQDKKTTGWYMSPGRHGGFHREKYHHQGKPCPVAVSVGDHPLIFGVSSMPLTTSLPEYNFAGAIRQKPVKVIREELTGLPIPAFSEIVLVGWSPRGKEMPEGPFGEWTGYYGSKEKAAPIIEVERIYHRNKPVLLGSPPFRPPSDNSYFRALFKSAMSYNELVKNGVPDVKGLWTHEFGERTFTVVSIKQRYAGHAKQAALIADQNRVNAYLGRFVVVVDDDIDPTNITDVLWAMCFRCDPEKDIDIVRRTWGSALDPLIRKPSTALFNSRAIIDACKPFEWIDEFPKEVKPNPEVARRVKERWGNILGV